MVDNIYNEQSKTAINSLSYIYGCPNSCPYYLPCGYCSKMYRPCIKNNGWSYVTTTHDINLGSNNESGS